MYDTELVVLYRNMEIILEEIYLIKKIAKSLALIIFILAASAGLAAIFFTCLSNHTKTQKTGIDTAAKASQENVKACEDTDKDTEDYEVGAETYDETMSKFLHQEAPMKELNLEIMENREGEMVFQASIDDFIDSYNGYYWKDKKVRYLLPALEWNAYLYDKAVHSDYETCCYIFSKDKEILPFPTITVYVPSNGDFIQEITVNFDDHSYMDSLYHIYEEMCFYTLKTVFPDLPDETLVELYTTLNHLAYENATTVKYTSESVPCVLYYRGNIGVYPYFALGECVHMCVVPITQEYLDELRGKGVSISSI